MNIVSRLILMLLILKANHGFSQPTWQFIGPDSVPVYSFTHNETYLFAGGNIGEGGIFRSDDLGDEWTEVNNGLTQNHYNILSMLSTDTAIYSCINYQLFITRDSGEDWDLVNTQISSQTGNIIGFAGEPWNIMYVGGNNLSGAPAVMISPDGSSWSKLNTGLPSIGGVYSMIAHDTSLYAGTYRGVYRYDLSASSWKVSNIGLPYTEVFTLAKNDEYFFAGTRFNGVFRSIDGRTWTSINTTLDSVHTTYNAFAFVGPEVYVGASGDNGGIYKSIDQGLHWAAYNVGMPEDVEVYALTVYPPYLYAGTGEHGVFRLDSLISGSANIVQKQSLSILPNPNHGSFDVQMEMTGAGNLDLTLTDLFGRQVYSATTYCESGICHHSIQASNLLSGIYILRASGRGVDVLENVVID